ncbi:MAG: ATP-grasp domain-containing protein, partial [bacterium]|nr:ATP-grasp domain-containing protein [bacterium]
MFQKVLIANRGEIALRVIRACQEMGLQTVAVHSTADQDSMHVRFADESVCIGGPAAKDSYLNIQAILSAAEISGAEAIHPGVGFLSESPEFATMVREHGLKFIGPSPEHIALMGDKITAKAAVKKLGIPVVPGSDGPVTDIESAVRTAEKMSYPVIVKAASGGGGKGMQVCHNSEELREKIPLAQTEARINFGNDQVFLEKYLTTPRHIEIQVLGDSFGNAVHLGERDCSIQRRHQKVWEEAPSISVTEEKRHQLGETARQAVAEMGYEGAGTFEFLYENGEFYFIE